MNQNTIQSTEDQLLAALTDLYKLGYILHPVRGEDSNHVRETYNKVEKLLREVYKARGVVCRVTI